MKDKLTRIATDLTEMAGEHASPYVSIVTHDANEPGGPWDALKAMGAAETTQRHPLNKNEPMRGLLHVRSLYVGACEIRMQWLEVAK